MRFFVVVGFLSFCFEMFNISDSLDMSSEKLREMSEGDSEDICSGKFPCTSTPTHLALD